MSELTCLKRFGLSALLLSLLNLGVASHAYSQPFAEDYSVKNSEWNGLSDIVAILEQQNIEVLNSDTLDYSSLANSDIVVAVNPPSDIQAANLASFVYDGGKLLLAGEFHYPMAVLETFGFTHHRMTLDESVHGEYLDGNKAFPIFRSPSDSALWTNVSYIVANHPAVLFHEELPVVAYSEEGGLAFHLGFGNGEVIILGDASLFINRMLRAADNAQFLLNIFKGLCRPSEDCALQFFTNHFDEYGEYSKPIATAELQKGQTSWSDAINEKLASMFFDGRVITLVYYLCWLLVFGVAAYLLTIFPFSRREKISDRITAKSRSIPLPQTDYDWHKTLLLNGNKNTTYAVSILNDIFEEMVISALNDDLQSNRPWHEQQDRIVDIFKDKYLLNAAQSEQRRLENTIRTVIVRFSKIAHQPYLFWENDVFFSARELMDQYDAILLILEKMDRRNDYERRLAEIR